MHGLEWNGVKSTRFPHIWNWTSLGKKCDRNRGTDGAAGRDTKFVYMSTITSSRGPALQPVWPACIVPTITIMHHVRLTSTVLQHPTKIAVPRGTRPSVGVGVGVGPTQDCEWSWSQARYCKLYLTTHEKYVRPIMVMKEAN